MEPKISVIVPIYNVETYLKRCVKSIINQTYRNLEIILVDDGSPDKCGKICDEFAADDDRIKVIHKINGGLSDARNAGIKIATGEYIALVDSDDWINEQMLETLLKIIVSRKCQVAICDFDYAYEGKSKKPEIINVEEAVKASEYINRQQTQDNYFTIPEKRNIYTVAWNKLYHKSLFDSISYPKGKVHEDEFTTFKLLYKADGICFTDKKLYYYFVRNDSIMGAFKPGRFDIFDGYVEKMDCYIKWGEDILAKKILFHAMHMLAQYKKWMEESDDKNSLLKELLHEKKQNIIKKMKYADVELSLKEYFEIILFKLNFNAYYMIWKKHRG